MRSLSRQNCEEAFGRPLFYSGSEVSFACVYWHPILSECSCRGLSLHISAPRPDRAFNRKANGNSPWLASPRPCIWSQHLKKTKGFLSDTKNTSQLRRWADRMGNPAKGSQWIQCNSSSCVLCQFSQWHTERTGQHSVKMLPSSKTYCLWLPVAFTKSCLPFEPLPQQGWRDKRCCLYIKRLPLWSATIEFP